MITLVFGSRMFENQGEAMYRILELMVSYCKAGLLSKYRNNFVLVTGGAVGTDKTAIKASRHVGVPVAVVKPNYDKFKHYATHKRNDFMIKRADKAIGFWHGDYVKSGTASVALKCLIKHVPLILNRWDNVNGEFVEIEPEVFVNNAPLDWLKKWTTLRWIRAYYPAYPFKG